MIQTWTWEAGVPQGRDLDAQAALMVKVGTGVMEFTAFLLGVDAEPTVDGVLFTLKVSGKDRWACQAHARDIGEKILKASKLFGAPITHISTVIEPNRRGLTTGQGRTPRPRPPRTAPVS